MIPVTNVTLDITFSAPRSLTLANRLSPSPPVKAPLRPSDFQLCNKESIINMTAEIINKISKMPIIILLSHDIAYSL